MDLNKHCGMLEFLITTIDMFSSCFKSDKDVSFNKIEVKRNRARTNTESLCDNDEILCTIPVYPDLKRKPYTGHNGSNLDSNILFSKSKTEFEMISEYSAYVDHKQSLFSIVEDNSSVGSIESDKDSGIWEVTVQLSYMKKRTLKLSIERGVHLTFKNVLDNYYYMSDILSFCNWLKGQRISYCRAKLVTMDIIFLSVNRSLNVLEMLGESDFRKWHHGKRLYSPINSPFPVYYYVEKGMVFVEPLIIRQMLFFKFNGRSAVLGNDEDNLTITRFGR